MIELVISGGQTGADQAGWRAAKKAGIKTGGWMPLRFRTEAGKRPIFSVEFGAQEHASYAYPPRTETNISISDATIFFGRESSGFGATYWAAVRSGKPFYHVGTEAFPKDRLISFLNQDKVVTLNVAGNRESSAPGIGEWVERYLDEVFRLLKGNP